MLRALLALIFALSIAAPAGAQGAPPLDQSTAWFYLVGNQTQGPLPLDEMQDLTRQGVIRPSTQVHSPARGWAFAKDTPELQPYLSDAAPVATPPSPPVPPYVPPQAPGAATGGVQAELDRAISDFLIGGWTSLQRSVMAGRAFETTTAFHFRADGSYDAIMSTAMPEARDLPPTSDQTRGYWTARALDPDRFLLTLDQQNGLPPDQFAFRVDGQNAMVTTDGAIRLERLP
jgi:hypothetical protein